MDERCVTHPHSFQINDLLIVRKQPLYEKELSESTDQRYLCIIFKQNGIIDLLFLADSYRLTSSSQCIIRLMMGAQESIESESDLTAPTLKITVNYDFIFIRSLSRLSEKCIALAADYK